MPYFIHNYYETVNNIYTIVWSEIIFYFKFSYLLHEGEL